VRGEEFCEAFFKPGRESACDPRIKRGVDDFMEEKVSLVVGLLLRLHPDDTIEVPSGMVSGYPLGNEFQHFELLLVSHQIADERTGVVDERCGWWAEELVDDSDKLIHEGRKGSDFIGGEIGIEDNSIRSVASNALLPELGDVRTEPGRETFRLGLLGRGLVRGCRSGGRRRCRGRVDDGGRFLLRWSNVRLRIATSGNGKDRYREEEVD